MLLFSLFLFGLPRLFCLFVKQLQFQVTFHFHDLFVYSQLYYIVLITVEVIPQRHLQKAAFFIWIMFFVFLASRSILFLHSHAVLNFATLPLNSGRSTTAATVISLFQSVLKLVCFIFCFQMNELILLNYIYISIFNYFGLAE